MARSARMPKALARLQAKHPDKIDEVYVERDEFDGWSNPFSYWLHLKKGWWNPRQETHMIHETKMKDLMEVWREIEPCSCEDCTS